MFLIIFSPTLGEDHDSYDSPFHQGIFFPRTRLNHKPRNFVICLNETLNSYFRKTTPPFPPPKKNSSDFNSVVSFFPKGKTRPTPPRVKDLESLSRCHDIHPSLQGNLGISTPGFGSHCSTWPGTEEWMDG